jgi:hypothetical protein
MAGNVSYPASVSDLVQCLFFVLCRDNHEVTAVAGIGTVVGKYKFPKATRVILRKVP